MTEVTEFPCPGCEAAIQPDHPPETRCPSCGWKGRAFLFRPLAPEVEQAELALPEDAACAHHPNKRAVEVCTGTGDYICSLCAVEMNGKTYSAQYLEGGGKEIFENAVERYLPRPDRMLATYLLVCLVFSFVPAPIIIPFALHSYYKMLRLRETDDLYRRLVGPGRMIVATVLLLIIGAAAVGWGMVFLFGILGE